jgi:hypothetical protein
MDPSILQCDLACWFIMHVVCSRQRVRRSQHLKLVTTAGPSLKFCQRKARNDKIIEQPSPNDDPE